MRGITTSYPGHSESSQVPHDLGPQSIFVEGDPGSLAVIHAVFVCDLFLVPRSCTALNEDRNLSCKHEDLSRNSQDAHDCTSTIPGLLLGDEGKENRVPRNSQATSYAVANKALHLKQGGR